MCDAENAYEATSCGGAGSVRVPAPADAPGSPGDLGSAHYLGEPIRAAHWDSYVLRYTAGDQPIGAGGTVRVQLPDAWHAWRRNGAKGVQSRDPSAENYVSATVAAGIASVRCEVEGGVVDDVVKSNRVGLDGREGRYVYVTRVTVTDGELRPGDQLDIVFGDKAGGSRGFAAALNPQGPETVPVAVDPDGSGQEWLLAAPVSPVLGVAPNVVFELLGYAPSLLGVGERATLRVVAVDVEGNRVHDELPLPRVSVAHGAATVGEVRDTGRVGEFEAPFEATAVGTLRLKVELDGVGATVANPSWISEQPPARRLYWGDLHSHADHSFDGVGHYPYEYARDVSCLDFYALTEHCERWNDGDWEFLVEQVGRFHKAGSFVVFLAYEATFPEPWGHHNVYFRDPADAVVLGADSGTVLDLWQALDGRRALTIPHHTGVAFSRKTAGAIPGSTSPAVDWQYHDPELRRAVEIYSGHGQSELYDPEFDLSYESSDFSTNTSRHGPHYARDAWLRGHELGVIASSDNHRAQPGRGELGLAAVYAPELEREAMFDAIHDRASYGTTGARILLQFTAAGAPMGSRVAAARPEFSIRVSGTEKLEVVELFGAHLEAPDEFECLADWRPDGPDFAVTWTDPGPEATGTRVYYLRARQRDAYRGRKPTAWSSPIWVTPSTAADKLR
jgi:hypothetical protein